MNADEYEDGKRSVVVLHRVSQEFALKRKDDAMCSRERSWPMKGRDIFSFVRSSSSIEAKNDKECLNEH